MSEDINKNNEPVVEDEKAEEILEELTENAPEVPETKVEEVAEELGITASVAENMTVVEENSVIGSTKNVTKEEPKSSVVNLKSGAIGSGSADRPAKKSTQKAKPKEDTVAIHSTRNVTWNEVGKIYRGYNIVSKTAGDKWLTRDHTRLATPEEVAREFGK
jgi:hypothetical protein